MADEQVSTGYGYETDEVAVSPYNFGLNNAYMTKFGWIHNAGKNGAELEALDIEFTINGKAKSYRRFPFTKAFGKNNEEITDSTASEFKEGFKDWNAIITHIAHSFIDNDTYKAATSRPFSSFKEFCEVVTALLPKDFATKPLDIFMQYQWQPSSDQTRTFLEVPTKMKSGAWLKPAQPGEWKEHILDSPRDNDTALWYTNEKGEQHPITKNGWFMKSNYARKQGDDSAASTTSIATGTGAASSNGAANAAVQNTASKPAATW